MTLDEVLDELEELVHAQSERHTLVVVVEPCDDREMIERKRLAALERLGVPAASVELTVYVRLERAT